MNKANIRVTATMVESMKKRAKKLVKAEGLQHARALEVVAKQAGFDNWAQIAAAARETPAASISRIHPPIGTPGQQIQEGNSAPAQTLVAGWNKSERTGELRGSK